jgi:hypothetical protein
MTPIDDELRTTLRDRAAQVPTSPDPLAGIERRARGIRRHRLAAAATGGVLALAAIAVAVPTISWSLDADKPAPGSFAVQPTDTVAPRDTASPATSPNASASPTWTSTAPPQVPTVETWTYAGMNTIADGANRIDMLQKMSQALAAHWPGAQVTLEKLRPLYGVISSSDQLILVAAGEVTGNPQAPAMVAAAWVKSPNAPATLVGLHDIDAEAGQVSVFVPAAGQPGSGSRDGTAIVVGRAGTGEIDLKTPGGSWRPAARDLVDGRIAAFPVTMPAAGQVVPQIRVLDGDGNLGTPLYEGPIGRGVTFPDI